MDSEPSDADDEDDEDALTYATDQSYRTPPQEEAAVLQPIEVEEAPTCTCPPAVLLSSDPIKILDTEEEEDKENDLRILNHPVPIVPPRTEVEAVGFQRAIRSGHWKPDCPRPYPAITFPRLAYPGLSLQAEIRRSFWKARGVGKIVSIDHRGLSGYAGGDSDRDNGEDDDSESVCHSIGPVAADFDRAQGSRGGSPRYQPEESPVGERGGVGYRDAG